MAKEIDMATYVLVHGGGHGGWCYRRVARILRSAGHEVHTPTLTGLGERAHLLSPGIDLDLHILDVTTQSRLWDIDTGHDLMITEPQAVADALLEIAAH